MAARLINITLATVALVLLLLICLAGQTRLCDAGTVSQVCQVLRK